MNLRKKKLELISVYMILFWIVYQYIKINFVLYNNKCQNKNF